MSQQCHFQTSVCYMHYIKRDIFVFKVNLHSFKKEKSKNAKTTQNMVNFFIVNVQKKHEHVFFFNDNSFLCFFFTLPNTPLCTTFCLEKCSKCVFIRADYLILFQINILAIRKLTIDML